MAPDLDGLGCHHAHVSQLAGLLLPPRVRPHAPQPSPPQQDLAALCSVVLDRRPQSTPAPERSRASPTGTAPCTVCEQSLQPLAFNMAITPAIPRPCQRGVSPSSYDSVSDVCPSTSVESRIAPTLKHATANLTSLPRTTRQQSLSHCVSPKQAVPGLAHQALLPP